MRYFLLTKVICQLDSFIVITTGVGSGEMSELLSCPEVVEGGGVPGNVGLSVTAAVVPPRSVEEGTVERMAEVTGAVVDGTAVVAVTITVDSVGGSVVVSFSPKTPASPPDTQNITTPSTTAITTTPPIIILLFVPLNKAISPQ